MGHYSLIIVAGFVITGGLVAVGMRADTRIASLELAQVQYKEEARDAAIASINLTLRRVVSDRGDWTVPSKYELGETEYRRARFQSTVTVSGLGDTLDVTSVGTKDFINRSGQPDDTTHTIDVRIIRTQLAGGRPPGFDVAIVTDKNLSIRGNFEVNAYDPNQNADVHANGTLETKGNSFSVEGFGSYTNADNIKNPGNFVPNDDWNGPADNVVYGDTIQIPPIDLNAFRLESQSGQGVYNAGDVSVDIASAGYSSFSDWAIAVGAALGTGASADHPFVFFSDGSISFSGNALLSGFGVFVSAGDMHINSQTQIHGAIGVGPEGFPATQMGIYAAGDLRINGGADITATIYSNGYTTFNGNASITGGAILRDIGKLNGTFNLIWAGPNDGIIKNFGGTRNVMGPTIAAWAEW